MAESGQQAGDNLNILMSDFNTRLRDTTERNRLIRERVLLLGKNFITSRNEVEEELNSLKRDNASIKRDLEKLKKTANNLLVDFNKFAKKDEMILIERMLKDFQPLDFMRKKDIENLIEEKLKSTPKKEINTPSP